MIQVAPKGIVGLSLSFGQKSWIGKQYMALRQSFGGVWGQTEIKYMAQRPSYGSSGSMFFDPKSERIHVFRPEKRADPCVSTRKAHGSMFFDLKSRRIHAFCSEKHADPCFSNRKDRGSMFVGPKSARVHIFRNKKRVDLCFSTRKARGSMFFDPKSARIDVLTLAQKICLHRWHCARGRF